MQKRKCKSKVSLKKKFKLSKKQKRDLTIFSNWMLNTILIFVSVGLFLSGAFLVLVGFHNFDMGRNYLFLSSKENINMSKYVETNFAGVDVPITEMYTGGLQIARIGFWMMIKGFVVAMIIPFAHYLPDMERWDALIKGEG